METLKPSMDAPEMQNVRPRSTWLYRGNEQLTRTGMVLLLTAGGLLMALPFVWIVLTSLKTSKEIYRFPPTLIRLAYKCLGSQRLCVVSDATSGAGLPEGARFQMGNLEYEVHDGVGMLLDRTAFAGSTTLLNRMVHILYKIIGLDLAEVIHMASLTPARVIGLGKRKGSLEPGKDADIAIFEEDFRAWKTMIKGKWVAV